MYFDYKSYDISIKSITPGRWDDEFENDESMSEKEKGFEISKQP